ncbi:MAG: hypothetical protein CL484_07400 [Acidobacteria bacterium]|nr:hypothetical protein [Acidobacteriota bacterium]
MASHDVRHRWPTDRVLEFTSSEFAHAVSQDAPDAVLKAVLNGMNHAPQRSREWFAARSGVKITGSRLSGLLFLGSDVQELFTFRRELLGVQARVPFTPEIMERIQFGRDNEEQATVSTLTVMASAAQKPVSLFEAGFTRHPMQPMGASPDGVVVWPDGKGRPSDCVGHVGNFELKCSTKGHAHAQLPYYYVPQILFESRALSVASGQPVRWTLFSSWSTTTQKIWTCPFNDAVWHLLWSCVVELLLLDESSAHEVSALQARLRRLRVACERYVQSHTTPVHPRGGFRAVQRVM